MGDLVIRQDADGVCSLTLNRPEKLNALNVALFAELKGHVEALKQESDTVGVVALRGAGKCFSAGHDLADIAAGEELPEKNFQANIIMALSSLPQIVVTAIHGHCYTGALELALAGDILLASENAKLADTHAKWGLAPVWGLSQRLPRRIGRAKALEMMSTCRTYSGREAEAMGLVNACYADDVFERCVDEFCRSILENAWYSVHGNKMLIDSTEDMPLSEGLSYEISHSPGLAPDAMDRVAAFTKS